MNPGNDMIMITNIDRGIPNKENSVWINKRDVFLIIPANPAVGTTDKWNTELVVVRWQNKEFFYVKETAEEILKLMGREE
jgi:hypothetical protein